VATEVRRKISTLLFIEKSQKVSVRETNHYTSELLVMYHLVFTFLGIPRPTSYARTACSVGISNTSRDTRHSQTIHTYLQT